MRIAYFYAILKYVNVLQSTVENFYYRTFNGPLLRFLKTFYNAYKVKCAQRADNKKFDSSSLWYVTLGFLEGSKSFIKEYGVCTILQNLSPTLTSSANAILL